MKILLETTRNKKKRQDKILMLAESKLYSIEKLVSKALNDMEISHEKFIIILDEKDKYERMKQKIIDESNNDTQYIQLV